MKRRLKVFFDGGCRPNPGLMEAAVVVRGQVQFFDDLGTGSNTDAEWQALLSAIKLARELGEQNVEFIGDSLDVTRRANFAMSTGQARSAHAAAFLSLLEQYRPGRIRWIKREQNLAGIALDARRGLQGQRCRQDDARSARRHFPKMPDIHNGIGSTDPLRSFREALDLVHAPRSRSGR